MEEFINSYMKFRMNMLTHQIETQLIADAYTDRPEASACHWQRLTDHIENSLWCAMQHHGMAVNLNELHTLLGSDFVKEYHPLKEYLDGLPPWDGETDYIGRWPPWCMSRKVRTVRCSRTKAGNGTTSPKLPSALPTS